MLRIFAFLFERLQLILPRAEADLFRVNQSFLPVHVRVAVEEVVVLFFSVGLPEVVAQLAVLDRRGFQRGIHRGLVHRHRVKGSEEA